MAGVVELIDRAVSLPPGPRLSAALAGLAWEEIPNARLVEVLQARSRQLAHEQAGLFAGLVEIARAVPVAELPADGRETAVARAGKDAEWAAHEIAAGLTWTPTAADRELGFALVLLRELPLVFAALQQGDIDRPKAKIFVDHLDPSRGELTAAQIRRLCARFVPLAPSLTTLQLSRRLLRAIVAIDPHYYRRRYRRSVRERGVVLHLDRGGTATLSGEGLPPEEAAAAAARLDRLAEAARRAGHPGRLAQINADLYVGMLDGSFHGLTEAEILARLLAHPRTEDQPDTDATGAQGATVNRREDPADNPAHQDRPDENVSHQNPGDQNQGDQNQGDQNQGDQNQGGQNQGGQNQGGQNQGGQNPGGENSSVEDLGDEDPGDGPAAGAPEKRAEPPRHPDPDADTEDADTEDADTEGVDTEDEVGPRAAPIASGATDDATTPEPGGSGLGIPAPASARPDAPASGAPGDRWVGERVGIRDGVEIRVGLGTLLGLDERPGEIPGLGPVDAQVARRTVTAQHRGGEWRFAVVDTGGYLLLAGPLRRRPRGSAPPGAGPPGAGPPGRVHGGVVELHLSVAELRRFLADSAADPDAVEGWAGVLAEIADRWAERHRLRERLSRDPRARFARGALARHVQVRDRTCVGPGCTRPARRSELDHTRDHGRGGDTVEDNIGPGCWRHHADKQRGWTLAQPLPGLFVWTSPLGRTTAPEGSRCGPTYPNRTHPRTGSIPATIPTSTTASGRICASCGDRPATRTRHPHRNPTTRRNHRSDAARRRRTYTCVAGTNAL